MSTVWNSRAPAMMLAGLLFCAPALAWNTAEVIRGLAHEQADAARFTEIKYLQALERPIRLDGEVRFMPPDGMEKHVTAPYEERMTVQSGMLRLQRGDKLRELELERHPVAQAFVTAFTATLAGDVATLEQHYAIELSGNERAWQLDLTPRDSKLAGKVNLIRVTGSGQTLQSFETLQPNGDRAIMYFSALPQDVLQDIQESPASAADSQGE